jgi:MFS family permease
MYLKEKANKIFYEFPKTFWVLMGATFIDRVGGALIFPFLSLYVTSHFNVGMTEVGIVFAVFAISSVVGSVFGGAMTDRFGRKSMLLFGLITSALSSLAMGFINDFRLFYLIAGLVGLLSNTAGPAQQAMVADLLPEEKRSQGFSVIRVIANLAITIGPLIGGLMASYSFILLFISDAILSTITALIVFFSIPETKPELSGEEEDTLMQSLGGYGDILRDWLFVVYVIVSIMIVTVYMQMNSSLPVYLRDVHGVTTKQFGYILSLNAGLVVFFQFWITRKISRYKPMFLIAIGSLLYAIGYAMYGFVSTYVLFLVAMVIITIGEMINAPTSQSIVANIAPVDMRGRYMAIFGLSWAISASIGPLLAGLVMDNFNPNWVWYGAGIMGIISAICFFLLNNPMQKRLKITAGKADAVIADSK